MKYYWLKDNKYLINEIKTYKALYMAVGNIQLPTMIEWYNLSIVKGVLMELKISEIILWSTSIASSIVVALTFCFSLWIFFNNAGHKRRSYFTKKLNEFTDYIVDLQATTTDNVAFISEIHHIFQRTIISSNSVQGMTEDDEHNEKVGKVIFFSKCNSIDNDRILTLLNDYLSFINTNIGYLDNPGTGTIDTYNDMRTTTAVFIDNLYRSLKGLEAWYA